MALGKKVTFNIPYWPNYPANGEKTLTDGLRGGWNYNDKRWLGFANNHRMDVVIDLEKVTKIHSVSADFMQIWGPYVYMPSKVVISSSVDGKDYTQLTAIDHQVQKMIQCHLKNLVGKVKLMHDISDIRQWLILYIKMVYSLSMKSL